MGENLSLSTALWGDSKRMAVETLYRFRDEMMTQSAEGRRYIRLFSLHLREGTWLLLRYPDLRMKTRDIWKQLLPKIQAVTDGQPAVLTLEDLGAIEGLMDAFSAKANPQLRLAIAQLRSDLRRRDLLSRLGIGIKFEQQQLQPPTKPTSRISSPPAIPLPQAQPKKTAPVRSSSSPKK